MKQRVVTRRRSPRPGAVFASADRPFWLLDSLVSDFALKSVPISENLWQKRFFLCAPLWFKVLVFRFWFYFLTSGSWLPLHPPLILFHPVESHQLARNLENK
jgi:hypothetical protein